ncbi:MAG: hypothetical protein IT328_21375 [Caldilineaceae bacterium]|nr:hypothetical protein [Caldilineaceae bacterium]
MHAKQKWMGVAFMAFACLALVACGGSSKAATKEQHAIVEAVEGAEFNRITLTERAAERLGIASEPVREEAVGGSMKTVVPYAAIIYGLHGETWAYTRNSSENPLLFMRVPLTVERVEGDVAILADGPELGVEVVTVGVAQLYGTDTGVGK